MLKVSSLHSFNARIHLKVSIPHKHIAHKSNGLSVQEKTTKMFDALVTLSVPPSVFHSDVCFKNRMHVSSTFLLVEKTTKLLHRTNRFV